MNADRSAFHNSARPGMSKQTGPKGVLNDYRKAKLKDKVDDLQTKVAIEREMERVAYGTVEYTLEPNLGNKNNENLDSDEEADAEFEMEWRRKKIAAMYDEMPKFGSVMQLCKSNFKSQVFDNVPKGVHVIVQLYKNTNEACVRLSASLQAIAKQFTYVKFVRIDVHDIFPKYHIAGLPTVIVVKDGQQLKNYVRITDKLPKHFLDKDVVSFLHTKGYLQSTIPVKEQRKALEIEEEKRCLWN